MTLQDIVAHAYDNGGFTTRSNYFRANPELVAEAACRGLITTQRLDGSFGNCWRASPLGLALLFKSIPSNEEDTARPGRVARSNGDTCLFGNNYSG